MKKLMKAAREVVDQKQSNGDENLIDKAVEANAAASSEDPAEQSVAVDFDREIKALQESTKPDDTPEEGSDPQPSEGGDSTAEGGADEGAEGNASAPEDGGEPEGEAPPEDPLPEDELSEEDKAAFDEVKPTDTDPSPKTEAAVESMGRLARVLEQIEHAELHGNLDDMSIAMLDEEVDAAAVAANVPPLPTVAAENVFTDKVGALKDKAVKVINAIIEAFRKAAKYAAGFVKHTLNVYRAYNGNYKKTASGMRTRLDTLRGVVIEDQTINYPLGALSNNRPTLTLDTVLEAGRTAMNFAVGLSEAASKMDRDIISKLAKQGAAPDPAGLAFPNPAKVFKAGESSISLINDGVVDYSSETFGARQFIELLGMTGGWNVRWEWAPISSSTSWADVTAALQQYRFNTEQEATDNTEIEVPVDLASITKLLDAYEALDDMDSTDIHMVAAISTHQVLTKVLDNVLGALKANAGSHAYNAQEAARAFSLWSTAFERVYVRSVVFANKYAQSTKGEVLKMAGVMLKVYDDATKPAK